MYLVELRPGKEELYRTGDDLALAIRAGDVDARSRIYHRVTAKWISITLHPQYKAIVAGQTDEPMARPARKAWGLFPPGLTGQGAEMSSNAEAAGGSVRHRWKRPMGLGLAGLLLVMGIQLASSGPRPPWAGHTKTAAVVTRHQTPAAVVNLKEGTELISLASSTTVWPATAEPASNTIVLPDPVEVAPAAALPRAPRLRARALRSALLPSGLAGKPTKVKANSVEALLRGYEAASDKVGARLEGGMRVARLNQLFARGRLSPGGGVTDTRLSLAGAVNFIRVYRQQQATVEKAYQDSVDQLARLRRWNAKDLREWHSRPLRKEAPTLELVSQSLVSGIDSMLGVLDANAGAYKVRGTAIAFEDPAASQVYGALRRWIKEQIDAAVAAGAATSSGPTNLLLQAIGTSTLPRET
ncbi:MAG TPA: hypothetical protein VNO19_05380 [Gemmatimonadales bacterium]|nr:hypothetical protein [Gemmatimonadales bacterium]